MDTRIVPTLTVVRVTAALLSLLWLSGGLAAQTSNGVYENERFELGDGVSPPVAGMADLEGDLLQLGPDWDDVFDAQRNCRDVYDEVGNAASPNGVPDFLDTYGQFRSRRDAAFILDDVSAGTSTDSSVPIGPGVVGSGTVEAVHDLGNVYAYSTFDAARDLILYVGVERLTSGGPSSIILEFNQKPFSLDAAGAILGQRSDGDVRVQTSFSSGGLGTVSFESWSLDPADDTFKWLLRTTLNGEECNAAGTACAVCNAAVVPGGSWPSFDASGGITTDLAPNTLLELGLNVGGILGGNSLGIRYHSIQVTTPEDFALGNFERAHFSNR